MPQNIPSKNIKLTRNLLWTIVALGVVLRLYHLLDNRSLWEDEIYLSTAFAQYNLTDVLTKALPFQQKAPLGYLLVVKTLTMLFGTRELPLRLFPFICGILSLVIFVPVVQKLLKPAGSVVAMALLAFGPVVLYHSVEAKQYSVELFSVILLLYLYLQYYGQATLKKRLIWGIWGAAIVWFSFASIFVMAAMAAAIGLNYLLKKQFNLLIAVMPVFAVWFGSFIINYVLFTSKDSDTGWLVFFFVYHDSFMPLSAHALPWLVKRMVSFLNYPMGLSWVNVYNVGILQQAVLRMIFIPLLLAGLGIWQLYRNKKQLLLIIGFSFLVVFAASALKLYPFHERLTLFLAPLFIVLLAAGVDFFYQRPFKSNIALAVLALMLVFGPVKNTLVQAKNTYLFGDYKKSFQREALTYLNNHYQPGDDVYVYWNDLPGYNLYKQIYPLKFTAVAGIDHRHKVSNFSSYFKLVDSDLERFKGKKRVWVIQHNHMDIPIGDFIGDPVWYYKENNGPMLFHDHLKQLAKPVISYHPENPKASTDVDVTLYDFSAR
ncbi:glycosyltransferase family 39 protein [Mucilaginibacter sp. UR6-1]|uniref:glycosyltransferase family 39 protein n=1 Tax=Mucilaginibacter sp. UR6-1 TaxID=1435643 RepID=UPI001E2B5BDB|nr:glycosyltransferase family 39 protein [Mucilaginibacter sp. UR6-1]MCC8410807.1 glycosyltransferase family 39 protein [Mucilaginibacter sp. UR6-1]